MNLRQRDWVGNNRRDARAEIQVIEVGDGEQIIVVVWPKRLCPKCSSPKLRIYGRTRDGTRRYTQCRDCGTKFLSEER